MTRGDESPEERPSQGSDEDRESVDGDGGTSMDVVVDVGEDTWNDLDDTRDDVSTTPTSPLPRWLYLHIKD